jgi:transcriptional regulator GlxA family with amidase domain
MEEIVKLLRDQQHGRNLSSTELAKRVNLSTSGLYRAFKIEMKISPRRYAKNEKLEAATKLLATTLLSIKQIALKAGFTDQSHFVRDFKRRYGVTPTKYRESNFMGLEQSEPY